MTTNLSTSNTLGEWAATYASASRIFMQNNLDFCCGGQKTIQDACREKGLDAHRVVAEILNSSAGKDFLNWNDLSVNELIVEILEKFHAKHRVDLEFLIQLAQKVETVHHDHAETPKGLSEFLSFLKLELESHMEKEEQILFPMFQSGQGAIAQMPVQVMMHEHVDHGTNLQKLKQIAHNYVLPVGACGSWQALYRGVEQLEKEIKEHISIENNILFLKGITQ